MSATEPAPKDNAGVIAPPPLIFLAALLLGIAMDWVTGISLMDLLLPTTFRFVLGVALMAGSLALILSAMQRFQKAGTEIPPWRPSTAIVETGLYAHLRNPMYAGMAGFTFAAALLLASDWIVVWLVPAMLAIHYGVVLREERYLDAKFGAPYRAYCVRVPRYGIPI